MVEVALVVDPSRHLGLDEGRSVADFASELVVSLVEAGGMF